MITLWRSPEAESLVAVLTALKEQRNRYPCGIIPHAGVITHCTPSSAVACAICLKSFQRLLISYMLNTLKDIHCYIGFTASKCVRSVKFSTFLTSNVENLVEKPHLSPRIQKAAELPAICRYTGISGAEIKFRRKCCFMSESAFSTTEKAFPLMPQVRSVLCPR